MQRPRENEAPALAQGSTEIQFPAVLTRRTGEWENELLNGDGYDQGYDEDDDDIPVWDLAGGSARILQ
jgi:hypothetical protein